jgi:hypothetical protein
VLSILLLSLQIVAIDEMSGSVEQFRTRFGYADTGDRALVLEWAFAGGMVSVVAAYSIYGFIAWRFFFDNVNQHSVSFFLEHDVRPLLFRDSVVLADNARIHKTAGTLQVLNRVTNGQYLFNAAYCPFFNPIERGFGNVLNEARLHEQLASRDPVGVLQRAFLKYSATGSHGHVAKAHFDVYQRNHDIFCARIEQEARAGL